MGPLKPRLPARLKTDDGLIHCAPEMPLKDLALFKAEFTVPAKDSFSLIGRRHIRSNNSWLHNSHRLLKGPNRCTLMIHPNDAAGLGLNDGDMAEVFNHVGSVELPVEITEDIMPSVVSMPHGFGHNRKGVKLSVAAANPGVSMNDLTDPGIVYDVSGNAVLNGVAVKIKKAA
jgi:anaerobic selenocysteine-containing dehydrogenase